MIEYLPTGEVVVTIDDEQYTLRRPKFGQWRHFREQITKASRTARDELTALSARVGEANIAKTNATGKEKEKAEAEAEAAAAALRDFADAPFYETSSEIIRDMFATLGDRPLPDDKDDWPVFLVADVTVPGQILNHWQTAPLVSGAGTTADAT